MADQPIILFDGVCNFCNASINFLIKQDKKNIFRFAPMQSNAGQRILSHYHLDAVSQDSFILIENNKVYKKSKAALKLSRNLSWYWQWIQIFRIVPNFLRDNIYNYIAKHRYKWFGKKDQCMIPDNKIRERFLT